MILTRRTRLGLVARAGMSQVRIQAKVVRRVVNVENGVVQQRLHEAHQQKHPKNDFLSESLIFAHF